MSAQALATNPRDLPFAALYMVEPGSDTAVLVSSTGFPPDHDVIPAALPMASSQSWPVADAIREHKVRHVVDLAKILGKDAPTGAWQQPSTSGGRLRHPGPGQRPERRHLVLDLGQRGEAWHRGGHPRGLDPVPGQRHDGDLLLHRKQHVGPAPRGDVEGGLQPAGRIAAERRDVVHPPHVPGHPAQAQPGGRQRLHPMPGPGQHGRALPGGQPGPVAQQDQHDRLRVPPPGPASAAGAPGAQFHDTPAPGRAISI